MATYTTIISRNLSKITGQANTLPMVRVSELLSGDKIAEYDGKSDMSDIYYWKIVELTDTERDTIKDALATPVIDEITFTETQAKQDVDLTGFFSAGELTTLGIFGPIAQGLGPTLTYVDFIIT